MFGFSFILPCHIIYIHCFPTPSATFFSFYHHSSLLFSFRLFLFPYQTIFNSFKTGKQRSNVTMNRNLHTVLLPNSPINFFTSLEFNTFLISCSSLNDFLAHSIFFSKPSIVFQLSISPPFCVISAVLYL